MSALLPKAHIAEVVITAIAPTANISREAFDGRLAFECSLDAPASKN